jgi:antitoxin component of MazEF toxin-antitoxin module
MLAKMTVKNQITLPKAVMSQIAAVEYFDVAASDGRIVLTPVRIQKADAVREKLAALAINEQDIGDAVDWVRHGD